MSNQLGIVTPVRLGDVAWLWQAVVLFAVTNVDDLVVLSVFFGRSAGVPGSTRHIVAGQYLGFVAILVVCAGVALGANLLPGRTEAYLGLIPLALGVRAAMTAGRSRADEDEPLVATPSVWVVAGVTIANGGDNVGVYVPAFTGHSSLVLAGFVAVFLVLVGVWCAGARRLAGHRAVASALSRWGHVIYPAALIAVGIAILVEGHAFGL